MVNSMYDVNQALPALENTVNSLLHANNVIIQNIVDAARGRATSPFFPVKDFLRTLAFEIKETFVRRPRYSSLLPLTEVFADVRYCSNSCFFSINNFEIHKIESFPFTVNGTIMTFHLPPSKVLIFKDVSLYSVNLVSDLLKCQTEYLHLYHCPANIFAFLPINNVGVCGVE